MAFAAALRASLAPSMRTIGLSAVSSRPFIPISTSRSHYSYSGPGKYASKDPSAQWATRDFAERGFTVGIGGPVGSGKTALVYVLCHLLTDHPVGVVTNDIFTQEDRDFLVKHQALEQSRIRAVETGGCPHAAIREDISGNLSALEDLTRTIARETAEPPLLLCESGGDNLAANFSPELADLTLYVIDVAGGDKVPRKGGPGITQSDLLIINKIDLAAAVGADLDVMAADAAKMRGDGATVFAAVKQGEGIMEIREFILQNFAKAVKKA